MVDLIHDWFDATAALHQCLDVLRPASHNAIDIHRRPALFPLRQVPVQRNLVEHLNLWGVSAQGETQLQQRHL